MSFVDRYRQYLHRVVLDHSTNHEEQGSLNHGLGLPADQFIDPSTLHLASRQPSEEDQPSFPGVAIDGDSALEASSLPSSCLSSVQDSFLPDFPDIHEPMGIADHLSGVAEASALMESILDEALFENPQLGEQENLVDFVSDVSEFSGPMDIDGSFPSAAEVPGPINTDEQFFDHPEIRRLVDIHDEHSGTLETPEPMDAEAEGREEVPDCGLASPAPSSPLSLPPPSPMPDHPEAEDAVYNVEKILQAWGPPRRRQYLIRWEGWGPEWDSWEPARNVSTELKAEFEEQGRRRRHGRKRNR